MSTLLEIEAAVEALPPAQQAELARLITARLNAATAPLGKARLVRDGEDVLLEAVKGAPAMTPENVGRMLLDWP